MTAAGSSSGGRPDPDSLLEQIADYVCRDRINSDEAWSTAHLCLKDSLACALLALDHPECVKLLGPIVPGLELEEGARVPGTPHRLDPAQAAFDIGVLVRYLDFNDTWLAAEWGHPSDNLGAILAVADYRSRGRDRGADPGLARRWRSSRLSARAQYRSAQELGRGRCLSPCRAAGPADSVR